MLKFYKQISEKKYPMWMESLKKWFKSFINKGQNNVESVIQSFQNEDYNRDVHMFI
ncbi:MAG: hypothetical protein JXR60_07300 [Bacteroidales bacterium]|nr:hypothetical protein [Bacteroidales bacterium]